MKLHTAIKNKGKTVNAQRLGDESALELELINKGLIVLCEDGSYELFSREATEGSGERAVRGDYFKVDSKGYPYPNSREFFEKNHRSNGDGTYEQLPSPVEVWRIDNGDCEQIEFLKQHKSLVIDESAPDKYFSAPLWGTTLTAARDAVIVFYSVTRGDNGEIVDADFNFVAREEFELTYRALD